ncbi:unnamed protein product [Mytilus coruscus]|uniref:Uncharacterized protein n=1 Tax=Mytilus coruscus TaxID=42192 RepID=A0A6J8BG54_MYTCO|nr:unnamed protein product [Mytilus coruscus]
MYKDDQVLDISKIDKNLLICSKKGKPLSVQELTTNLRKLIFHRNPFNDHESILNKEIVHTWEDDNTSEQTCWNGRFLSYQNQEFEVKYWKENEELEEEDLYNLSLAELKEDFQGKLLTFKEWSKENLESDAFLRYNMAFKTVSQWATTRVPDGNTEIEEIVETEATAKKSTSDKTEKDKITQTKGPLQEKDAKLFGSFIL